MKIRTKYIFEFYGTVGVPLIYLAGLYFVSLADTLSIASIIRMSSLVIAFIGIALWIISYLTLKRSFGVLPRKQARIQRGIYQFIPHPMYIGITLTYLGLSLANQSLPGLFFTLLFLIPLLVFRAIMEEKFLS